MKQGISGKISPIQPQKIGALTRPAPIIKGAIKPVRPAVVQPGKLSPAGLVKTFPAIPAPVQPGAGKGKGGIYGKSDVSKGRNTALVLGIAAGFLLGKLLKF